MGRIAIRRMDISDLPQVYEIGREIFARYQAWEPGVLSEIFAKDMDMSFVAFRRHRILGIGIGEMEGEPGNRFCVIRWLGTASGFAEFGLEEELAAAIIKEGRSKGANMVRFECGQGCENLKTVLEKIGFVETSVINIMDYKF